MVDAPSSIVVVARLEHGVERAATTRRRIGSLVRGRIRRLGGRFRFGAQVRFLGVILELLGLSSRRCPLMLLLLLIGESPLRRRIMWEITRFACGADVLLAWKVDGSGVRGRLPLQLLLGQPARIVLIVELMGGGGKTIEFSNPRPWHAFGPGVALD